jgi:hypothetical protein
MVSSFTDAAEACTMFCTSVMVRTASGGGGGWGNAVGGGGPEEEDELPLQLEKRKKLSAPSAIPASVATPRERLARTASFRCRR